MGASDTVKLKLSSCGNRLDLGNKMTLRFVWKDNGAFNRKRGSRNRLERRDVEFCFIYKDLELLVRHLGRDAFENWSL